MDGKQSAETYALIWNIKDSEMCTKGGCTKAGWYISTCLGEDAQVWILMPWMYQRQFGTLCITGNNLTDNGTPWLEYKCRFHGQGVKDRSCMETEGEDIGDIAMLFSIKFRERGMNFETFLHDARRMTYWESLWKVLLVMNIRRWTVLAEHPDWIKNHSNWGKVYQRYVKTYWGAPAEAESLENVSLNPLDWHFGCESTSTLAQMNARRY